MIQDYDFYIVRCLFKLSDGNQNIYCFLGKLNQFYEKFEL